MKGKLEELGEETDENVENISKMQGQILNLTKGKVNIFDDLGNFKSTYEIMQGIAGVWDELNSKSQADLLETIAGKHRANSVAALLSNWENVEEAVKSATEAEGSAAKENAKYIDSIQGRLDVLKTAWKSFANTFMNSDFLKGAVTTLTKILNIVEKLVKSLGTIGTIGLGTGLYNLFKTNGITTILSTFASRIGDIISSTGTLGEKLKAVGTAGKMAGKDISSGMSSLSKAGTIIGLAIAAIGLVVNAVQRAKEEQSRLRQETIQASDEFLEASSSFEQAYIKYSGKTNLTVEEEADLESAIKGTVDALGDKSSALQTVVNNSNDYVASLEAIKKAELEAAKTAAEEKRDNAADELKEAAIGWTNFDGSEVRVDFGEIRYAGNTTKGGEAEKIAKEINAAYVNEFGFGDKRRAQLELPSDADVSDIIEYYNFLIKYKDALQEAGYEETSYYTEVEAAIEKMSESISVYTDGVYEAVKANYQLKNGIPKTTEEYVKMREAILTDAELNNYSLDQKIAVLNSLDSEYAQMFDLSSAEVQAKKFIGLIKGFGNGTIDGTNDIGTVETFLNMRTAVNNGECSVGEYMSAFKDVTSLGEEYSDEENEYFTTSLGLDTDKIKQQYDDMYKYLSRQNIDWFEGYEFTPEFRLEKDNIKDQEIREFIDGLTATELQALVNIRTEVDWENTNIGDIREQIEKEAALIEAISFTVNLELETEKLENLTTAVSESLSGAGLGTTSMSLVEDMFGDLDSYDPTKLFEQTANGIRMNSEEFRKLNDEYKNANVDGFENKLDALGERYNQTRDELSDLTYGSEEYNSKLRELNDIEDQINATEELATQYRGLTSAYQSWQRAESAGSQRDMYEGMIEGFETVDDEISRGWIDDGTIEFLRLIKGENLSATATTKELKEAYKSLDDTIKDTTYSVRDFFTVDEDGNSNNTGVYNFLDAIGQLEEEKFGGKDVVKRDKDGNVIGFDFKIVGGDEAIADALGISEELVQIMVRAADDAGFVVSMDGTYQQLDTLKDKAQEAADKLKELKITNFGFNLNTGSEKSVQDQYKEALEIWGTFKKNKNKDGTINMNVEGAEQAFTLVSTLQSMVDRLSEPTYMELDATQVEKDMQTPLSKLQEYEHLTQQENQLKLKGTDTSEIDKSQEEIIDYFEGLKPEVKAELGIKDLSREEIQAKVEAGEIEIPATIDLQVEMNNTLRDMVNVSLYNAGVIDEEELKKRVDVEVYAENVDTSDVDISIEKELKEYEKGGNVNLTLRPAVDTSVLKDAGWEDAGEGVATIFTSTFSNEAGNVAMNFTPIIADENGNHIGTLSPDELQEYAEGVIDGTHEDDLNLQIGAKFEGEDAIQQAETTAQRIHELQESYYAKAIAKKQNIEIIAETVGVEDVDGLSEKLKGLDDKTVKAIAEVLGQIDVDKLKNTMAKLKPKQVEAIATAIGQGDVDALKTAISELDPTYVQAIAEAFGYTDVQDLYNAIENLDPKTVEAVANALGITDVESLKGAIDNVKGKDVEVNATTSGESKLSGLKSLIDGIKSKSVTITSWFKKITSGGSTRNDSNGFSDANGTANVNGTTGRAFSQGNWRTKKSETALVGELGREIVVTPQNRWYTVGDRGAEFANIPRGSIVFNNRQTEELLSNGKATSGGGRAKALVGGTAFASGSKGSTGVGKVVTKTTTKKDKDSTTTTTTTTTKSSTSGSSGSGGSGKVKGSAVGSNSKSKSSSSAKEEFEETIDWIEIAISRIERAIDQLDQKANNVYKSWSSRNSALTQEIGKVGDEIELQQKAYDRYMSEASKVGLSSSWVSKIKNGTIDISTITDETLAEKIKEYQQW